MISQTALTLIHGPINVVLVDVPVSAAQSNQLVRWIKQTIQGKNLIAMYVTHGRADHFLGASIMQQEFPGLEVYVSNGVSEHITEELAPSFLNLGSFVPEPASGRNFLTWNVYP
jgi:glyoxylase-like metal-dependent hydrolase (beta-lactamase superfamily II)